MKTNIILAGVGGQGILTIAAVIDMAALDKGLFLKQSEVHGMSQRGGAVQSHVRISDKEIYSDLIPMGQADIILSVEPMELLRYLPYLKPDGWLITASEPFINITNYPDKQELLNTIAKFPNSIVLDAKDIAKKAGNSRAANIVLLGAASPYLHIEEEYLLNAIRSLFARKGERIVGINLDAFARGKTAGNH